MAPRLAHSDNIVFLFKCIEGTGIKIDFGKVGPAIGLNANTARMRYVRLRKAVEFDFKAQTPLSFVSSSLQHSQTSTPSPLTKDTIVRKRKALLEDSGDEAHENKKQKAVRLETDDLKLPTKRRTRGLKLDFTGLDNDSDSDVRTTDDSDSSSNFQEDSDTTDEEMNRQLLEQVASTPLPRPVKIVRLQVDYKKANIGTLLSPDINKNRSSPTASTPTEHADQQASSAFIALTPPETPTKPKAKMQSAAIRDTSTPTVTDSDFDLSSLQSGKKVPSTVFKQEPTCQTTQPETAHKPTTKPSRQPSTSPRGLVTAHDNSGAAGDPPSAPFCAPTKTSRRETHTKKSTSTPSKLQDIEYKNTSAATNPLAGSPTPDDSVSMVGEKRSYSSTARLDIPERTPTIGPTLMQRIASFWK